MGHIGRRRILLAVGVILAMPIALAQAPPAGKVIRIGHVSSRLTPAQLADSAAVRPLRQALAASGYVEGRNSVLEARTAEQSVLGAGLLFRKFTN